MEMDLTLYQDIIESLQSRKQIVWLNPKKTNEIKIDSSLIDDAEDRFNGFAPYFEEVFPETKIHNGRVESELQLIPEMQMELSILGNLY